MIVLESTTYPGTTDEDLREVLEAGSGLTRVASKTGGAAKNQFLISRSLRE